MFREPLCAVTVCLGYGDFLAQTAKINAAHFDKWTVVTSAADDETRHVCRVFGMHCLVTEDGTRDGTFSKGRMIERGLQHLAADAWILHLDADTVYPSTFRRSLERAHLDDRKIYGFDRFMVKNWADWRRLEASGWAANPHGEYSNSVCVPQGFQLGPRWVDTDGWVPIGYGQLWSRKGGQEEWFGRRVKPHPLGHGSACRSDVQHGLQWDRRDRVLLPEVLVAHLESEPCVNGANWSGRATKRFGPDARPGPAGNPSPS